MLNAMYGKYELERSRGVCVCDCGGARLREQIAGEGRGVTVVARVEVVAKVVVVVVIVVECRSLLVSAVDVFLQVRLVVGGTVLGVHQGDGRVGEGVWHHREGARVALPRSCVSIIARLSLLESILVSAVIPCNRVRSNGIRRSK